MWKPAGAAGTDDKKVWYLLDVSVRVMATVFLPAQTAHAVLRRRLLANSLLEEIKQGSIQRECREEVCSYEEAREAFENDDKTRRFWEEYVRESAPQGGIDISGLQSLYLILPLMAGLLLVAVVIVAVWRCRTRKLYQRRSATANGNSPPSLSLVTLDTQGRSYAADLIPPPVPTRVVSVDPPPSYEEAVGQADVHIHVDPPPQYEDIIISAPSGHAK
ncbi:transmembrane gamma-carboxyglutamic acid protein 1-like [Arapaima gigas]